MKRRCHIKWAMTLRSEVRAVAVRPVGVLYGIFALKSPLTVGDVKLVRVLTILLHKKR